MPSERALTLHALSGRNFSPICLRYIARNFHSADHSLQTPRACVTLTGSGNFIVKNHICNWDLSISGDQKTAVPLRDGRDPRGHLLRIFDIKISAPSRFLLVVNSSSVCRPTNAALLCSKHLYHSTYDLPLVIGEVGVYLLGLGDRGLRSYRTTRMVCTLGCD